MHILAKMHSYAIPASAAAIAFIVACVSHEVIGHGGLCLAGGGRITWLSSVYFHCSNGGPFGAAAGPIANLLVGALCWWLLQQAHLSSPSARLLVVLSMAFNLFWGAGYFIFSAIVDTGDWAWFLHDLALKPLWLWRSGMGALGIFLYVLAVRIVSRHWPAGVCSCVPYLAAGLVASLATLFYFGSVLPALRDAAQESFGAAMGLLLHAKGPRQRLPAFAQQSVSRNNYWAFCAGILVCIFWLTLGRGFGTPWPA